MKKIITSFALALTSLCLSAEDLSFRGQTDKDPLLYIDCFVDWSGRISNEVKTENSEKFTFLVGYEDLKNVQGVVDVQLDFLPVPELDSSRPVRILGRICSDGGKIYLRCKSVYQNIYN